MSNGGVLLERRFGEAYARLQRCIDRKRGKIVVLIPEDADKDAVASALSLDKLLSFLTKRAGKKKKHWIACKRKVGVLDAHYELFDLKRIKSKIPKKPSCVIVADCGDFRKTGLDPKKFGKSCFFLNFDHHARPANDFPKNGLQVIDSGARSATEVVFRFFEYLRAPIDQKVATYICIGIYADTGGLADLLENGESRESETFQIIYKCNQHKVPWEKILSCKPLTREALSIANEFTYEKRLPIAWMVVGRARVGESGGFGPFLDALDVAKGVRGVKVAVLFLQLPNGRWKVSFRSKLPGDHSRLYKNSLTKTISAVNLADLIGELGLGGGGHDHKAAAEWQGSPHEVLQIIFGELAGDEQQT